MLESKDPIPKLEPSESLKLPLANVSYVTLAGLIGVTIDTLHTWVRAGKIIQPTYFGTQARWTEDQAKRILAEGTKAAGTYPPADSPRAKQLQQLPRQVNTTLGEDLGRGRKASGGDGGSKSRPSKKRRGKK